MAPLTRFRADDAHVQLPIATEYYAQRVSVPGTLLIPEAAFISPRASGYSNPSALGRTASPDVLAADGFVLVSSSAVPVSGHRSYAARAVGGGAPRVLSPIMPPRRRTPQQLASMALEIHGANGYLIDQFTQDTCNRRTDAWGASIEKRARFGLAVAKAVVEAVGPERTGIRLSPFSNFQGMRMADPVPQFGYLIEGFKKLKLADLHVGESRISGDTDVETTETVDFAVDIWAGTSPVLSAGGFTAESAKGAVQNYAGHEVAILFGRSFIRNPDLPFRVLHGVALEPYGRSTFYKAKSPEGDITYPFSKEFARQTIRA